MRTNKTMNKLKLYGIFVKNQAMLSEIVIKKWERNKNNERTLQSKRRNLRHLNHLHHFLTANGQTILRENVGVVPMPLIHLNGSSKSIQQTIEMMGKTNETWPMQDLHQFSKSFKLKKPWLQWADYKWVRQYVISDPPTIVYHSHQTLNTGIATVFWQQEMEKAYLQSYNNMHMIHKTLPTYEYDYTGCFETQFRPLPEVVAYDTYFVDPQYGLDPSWDEDLYDQGILGYKDTYNKPNDQIESDNSTTDTHVWDAIRFALIDFWTVNPHLLDTSALPNFQPRPQNQQRQIAGIDDQILPQLQVTPDQLTRFVPLPTNLPLKNKRKMQNFPMDFGELNKEGLIDTGALSSAIPEADLRKFWLLAPHTILNKGPPPEFQIMVANGQLEGPIATVELQFEVGALHSEKSSKSWQTSQALWSVSYSYNATVLYLICVKESWVFPSFQCNWKMKILHTQMLLNP